MQLFYLFLSLVLIGVKVRSDRRAKALMSGSPVIKFGLWVLCNIFPFLLPNGAVLAYGYVARVGSTLFLIIQLFLLLDFVLTMNERWVAAAEEDDRNYKGMLAVTVACYVGCVVLIGARHTANTACAVDFAPFEGGMSQQRRKVHLDCSERVRVAICAACSVTRALHTEVVASCHRHRPDQCTRTGLLFHWFRPAGAGSCSFNVGVIVATILLFAAFTVVSMSSVVPSGSLFASAVISLYVVYLAYGALQSEPHTEVCNGLGRTIDAASGSTLAVGMLLMLLSVVYSAFKCAPSPAQRLDFVTPGTS
jgi:Serine incorporator (Serinc)